MPSRLTRYNEQHHMHGEQHDVSHACRHTTYAIAVPTTVAVLLSYKLFRLHGTTRTSVQPHKSIPHGSVADISHIVQGHRLHAILMKGTIKYLIN